MKVEGRKIIRRPCTLARTHTYIFISYPYFSHPSFPPLKTPYGSFLHKDEKSATEFPPLSQIPASLALRRRRCRWDVKSGSTTADVTNDRSRGRTILIPCKPLQRLKHHVDAKIYILRFRDIVDWEACRALHSDFAFVSRLWKETWVSM